jgi:hypothetical protein
MTAFDYVMRNGGADYSPPGPSHRRLQTASSAGAVSSTLELVCLCFLTKHLLHARAMA